MADRLAPTARCFTKSQASALAPTSSGRPDSHDNVHRLHASSLSNEVAGHMAGLGHEVTFHSQEIISDQVVDASRHAMR